MSEVLVHFADINAREAAVQLHETVRFNRLQLATRNLYGVIRRYGDSVDAAEASVRKGQDEADPEHYAVMNSAGNIVGAASLYDSLPLQKLHLSIPPVFAVGPLATRYPFATPNVHAWTDKKETPLLASAYGELLLRAQIKADMKSTYTSTVWSIEPVLSPDVVHKAIAAAGMRYIGAGLFDDAESHIKIPPKSVLYSGKSGDWFTNHGHQKQLRTGKKQRVLAEILDTNELDSTHVPQNK